MSIDAEHAELNEHLNAFLDGALDEVTRRRLERHLAACDRCREDVDQLRLTRDALRALPARRAPRPFTIPITHDAPAPSQTRWPAPWLAWAWRLGSLGAAACLLLAVATSFLAAPGAPATSFTGEPAAGRPAALADRDSAQRTGPTPRQPAPESAAARAPAQDAQNQQAGQSAGLAGQQGAQPTPTAAPAPAAPPAPPAPSDLAPFQPGAEPAPAPSRPPAASLWLGLAFVLAAGSAGLFALERRARS
jgi:anti-sigma factor RsiW